MSTPPRILLRRRSKKVGNGGMGRKSAQDSTICASPSPPDDPWRRACTFFNDKTSISTRSSASSGEVLATQTTKAVEGAARGVIRTLAHPPEAVPGSSNIVSAQSSSRVEPARTRSIRLSMHDRDLFLVDHLQATALVGRVSQMSAFADCECEFLASTIHKFAKSQLRTDSQNSEKLASCT
jgi:hypothetical protein